MWQYPNSRTDDDTLEYFKTFWLPDYNLCFEESFAMVLLLLLLLLSYYYHIPFPPFILELTFSLYPFSTPIVFPPFQQLFLLEHSPRFAPIFGSSLSKSLFRRCFPTLVFFPSLSWLKGQSDWLLADVCGQFFVHYYRCIYPLFPCLGLRTPPPLRIIFYHICQSLEKRYCMCISLDT